MRPKQKFLSTLLSLTVVVGAVVFLGGFYAGLGGLVLSAIVMGFIASAISRAYRFHPGQTATIFVIIISSVATGIYLSAGLHNDGSITFPTGFMTVSGLIIGEVMFIVGWAIAGLALKERPVEADRYDVILVLAFGRDQETNQPLLNEIEKHIVHHRVVCTQLSLWKFLPRDYRQVCLSIPQKSQELSTYGLIREFKSLAKKHGWRNIGLVTARQHLKRAARDLNREGFQVFKFDGIKVPFNYYDDLWWARCPLFWLFRESILRILPYGLYKKITTIPIGKRRPRQSRATFLNGVGPDVGVLEKHHLN
jgi:hypothetical protein